MSERPGDGWIGRPLKRREDHRLLTGAGAFVDDMTPPGCLHVALLRSPHAHARIAHLDVEAARRAPRTRLVVTGKEVAHLGPMPVNRLMTDMRVPPHPILAEGHVHAVGMPVAAVVAENVYAAYDALDLIAVDYEPLPGLADPEAALARRCSSPASTATACSRGAFGKATPIAPSRPRPTSCRCAWRRTGSPRWRWSRARSWPPSTASPTS
jgi:carbon-monoxide dehydrogenase large subunit